MTTATNNTSFIGATNVGNSPNEVTVNKNITELGRVDARTAIGELTYHKLAFNKSIIDLQLVLLTAIELAELGLIPPNIAPIVLSYAEMIRGSIARIEGIFSIANKFLLQFIDCLSKFYKTECDSTIYQSFITMIKKLYPSLDLTVSACSSMTQLTTFNSNSNTTPPGFARINVLLSEYEAYIAMNIYDMLVFIISIIDSLPDDPRKCKLAKCLFNNYSLFINGILFGVDYKVSKCSDAYDINGFIKNKTCKLSNRDTFLFFRSLFRKFEVSLKDVCEEDQCEVFRLVYMFISYIIEVVFFEGPVVHRTLVSTPGMDPSYNGTIFLAINNAEICRLISQIISRLPNPCLPKCKPDHKPDCQPESLASECRSESLASESCSIDSSDIKIVKNRKK